MMPYDVWTIDIIHDSCMNGSKFWILSIVAESTRECLAHVVSIHFISLTVRTGLCRLLVPRFLRSDNGGGLIGRSTAMLLHEVQCSARFIQPGMLWQNGFIALFHLTLRRDHVDVAVIFQSAGCPTEDRNIQKLSQPRTTTLGTGLQSTSRICNNKAVSLMQPLVYQMVADR
jgi:hypothetical protein